jgi:DNA-binding beta-propeller fold protein YncE
MRKAINFVFIIGSVVLLLFGCREPGRTNPINEIYVANGSLPFSITVYSRTADGDTAPLRTISSATGLNEPSGIAIDAVHKEIITTNRRMGGTPGYIAVYHRTDSGNIAPLRTITGTATSFLDPIGIAVDTVNGEIFVVDMQTDSVSVFNRNASGAAVPSRRIVGGLTGFSISIKITVDVEHNEIFITNDGNDSITVYNRTDKDNASPKRTIIGGNTHIFDPYGIALDSVNNEIFVMNLNSITVYNRTDKDNVVPKRTIAGASTKLDFTWGMCLDPANNELFIIDRNIMGDYEILIFNSSADGDIAPLRTLAGAATGLNGPRDIAVLGQE